MYNISRCSQGSAHRASSALLAGKGMYLDQLRAGCAPVSDELTLAIMDDVPTPPRDGISSIFPRDSHTLAAIDAIPRAVVLELQAHYQNRAAGVEGGCG